MAGEQLVVFNINSESFGISITQVKEIIKPMEIFKVPNTPDYIEGLINLRGKVHTVFNLRKKFGLPNVAFDDNTKIIIVNVNSMTIGFIVDEVNEIIRVEDENIENTPKALMTGVNSRYLKGVAKTGERIILILDLANALSITEEAEAEKAMKTAK
ncbi:MAG: chemotaxis protein CheW [Clostridia bacterium]|nr:chemotaxis protein CheW [Clostridia bacterium]